MAAREGIVHGLASALVDDCWPASITTSHGSVVLVLFQTVGETVADHDRLKIDVSLLVLLDLTREHGDVVSRIGLACDVEVLMSILRELLEEQGQESVDIFACCNGVADGASTV